MTVCVFSELRCLHGVFIHDIHCRLPRQGRIHVRHFERCLLVYVLPAIIITKASERSSCSCLELSPRGNFKQLIRAKDFWIMSLVLYLFYCFQSYYVERNVLFIKCLWKCPGSQPVAVKRLLDRIFISSNQETKGNTTQFWIYNVIFRHQCRSVQGSHSQHILSAYLYNAERAMRIVKTMGMPSPPYWRTNNLQC